MTAKHRIPCPYPDCGGSVVFAHDVAGGTYPCPCKAVQIRLHWSVPDYAYLEQRPYLSLAEKPESEAQP